MNRFGERIKVSAFNRRAHLVVDELQQIPTETKQQIRESVRSERLTREQAARSFALPLWLIDALLRQ